MDRRVASNQGVSSSSQDIPPPELGGYALVELIGRGGMGEVWRAERIGHAGIRRRAAVKRILPRLRTDRIFHERFLAEARTNARLEHPNIVQVLDFGDKPEPYLVLEYMEGVTAAEILEELVRTQQRLPASAAAFIVAEIATGLDYAHRRCDEEGRPLGIIHRDVTPQNCLVSIDGTVKITDFGVARAADNTVRTREGMTVGKLGYMAPEQIQGRPFDARADVFALGVVFWELLTTTRFMQSKDAQAALQMLITGNFPPPSGVVKGLPQEIDALVSGALAVDPSQRYASAGAFAQALRSFLHGIAPGFDSNELARILGGLIPTITFRPSTPASKAQPISNVSSGQTGQPAATAPVEPQYQRQQLPAFAPGQIPGAPPSATSSSPPAVGASAPSPSQQQAPSPSGPQTIPGGLPGSLPTAMPAVTVSQINRAVANPNDSRYAPTQMMAQMPPGAVNGAGAANGSTSVVPNPPTKVSSGPVSVPHGRVSAPPHSTSIPTPEPKRGSVIPIVIGVIVVLAIATLVVVRFVLNVPIPGLGAGQASSTPAVATAQASATPSTAPGVGTTTPSVQPADVHSTGNSQPTPVAPNHVTGANAAPQLQQPPAPLGLSTVVQPILAATNDADKPPTHAATTNPDGTTQQPSVSPALADSVATEALRLELRGATASVRACLSSAPPAGSRINTTVVYNGALNTTSRVVLDPSGLTLSDTERTCIQSAIRPALRAFGTQNEISLQHAYEF